MERLISWSLHISRDARFQQAYLLKTAKKTPRDSVSSFSSSAFSQDLLLFFSPIPVHSRSWEFSANATRLVFLPASRFAPTAARFRPSGYRRPPHRLWFSLQPVLSPVSVWIVKFFTSTREAGKQGERERESSLEPE